jgi:hypothetical protein
VNTKGEWASGEALKGVNEGFRVDIVVAEVSDGRIGSSDVVREEDTTVLVCPCVVGSARFRVGTDMNDVADVE